MELETLFHKGLQPQIEPNARTYNIKYVMDHIVKYDKQSQYYVTTKHTNAYCHTKNMQCFAKWVGLMLIRHDQQLQPILEASEGEQAKCVVSDTKYSIYNSTV